MAGWHPPQSCIWAVEALKPLSALLHDAMMLAVTGIGECREVGKRSPYRHVYENKLIFVRTQGCGIALQRLQAPDKAGTVIGKRIYYVQLFPKPCHDGIN